MWDLKALLIKVAIISQLRDIMDPAREKNVVDNAMIDVTVFDRVKQNVWWARRYCYRPKDGHKALRGETLKTQQPLEIPLNRWQLEMEQDVEDGHQFSTMFRTAIV
ncbi:hypothetical protein chiPu_0021783 [Chiloscyllium punctatum]|uniref:Uncharacterized protein n=1 Tax=Chiloscyllium punctatum TaxID=137246 RepID=A0A401RLY2_CHIPU|nr:hypothetical protein [Chiloscyllium punctatum]